MESGINRVLLSGERSERLFAFHAKRLGIRKLLDIGANSGQFAAKMRRFGFEGVIYSVEPQSHAHAELLRNAHGDLRWIPLPRQAAGRRRGTMKLNLAANTWSSSFFATHQNHLRAAPDTRTVAQEDVLVTGTADLLRPGVMADIDALKIDVQGYELEVLEGLRPLIRGVRLVLLEMSLVECYVGAPDLFQLDRLLFDELGFSRISIEPSFYDDERGVVQQFDGIYCREPAPAVPLEAATATAFSAVITSLHGVPPRIAPSGADLGEAWLQYCMRSWWRQSNRVMSVSETKPSDARIEWIRTPDRPAIADLLAAAPDDGDHPVILCNADIAIVDTLSEIGGQLDPAALYLANRFDVEASDANAQAVEIKSVYQLGFDLFILPPQFLRFIRESQPISREFRIGEPWWDYLLPLVALSAGFPVRRLPLGRPVALHYLHPTKYQPSVWLSRGADFFKAIARLQNNAQFRDIQLINDLLALEGPTESGLNAATGLVLSRLSS